MTTQAAKDFFGRAFPVVTGFPPLREPADTDLSVNVVEADSSPGRFDGRQRVIYYPGHLTSYN